MSNKDINITIDKRKASLILQMQDIPCDYDSFTTFMNELYMFKPKRQLDALKNLEKRKISWEYYVCFLHDIVPWMIKRMKLFLNNESNYNIERIPQNCINKKTYSKRYVCDLIIAMIFGLYECDSYERPLHFFNYFSTYCSTTSERLIALIVYLVYQMNHEDEDTTLHKEFITIYRNVLKKPYTIKMLCQTTKQLCDVTIKSTGKIGDEQNEIYVDFADLMIGGFTLTFGDLQEEIMFIESPELNITTLLYQDMNNNECITVQGFDKYANIEGYGVDIHFKNSLDPLLNHNLSMVAIDAIDYSYNISSQFIDTNILRDINKAYIGFDSFDSSTKTQIIGTGKWGCGAFMGNIELKFIQQWISCSLSNQKMNFYTFMDSKTSDIINFVHFIQTNSISIGSLCTIMFSLTLNESKHLFTSIMNHINKV